MAVTGVIMIGFLVSHVVANLLIFQGAEPLNGYAHFLHSLGELLWVARAMLIAAVILHIIAAVQLTLLDRAARPEAYARSAPQASTLASRTLRVGGVLLLAFVVYHLLHFTFGNAHPAFVPLDPYHNIISGFAAHPLVAGFYVLAMVGLGLHLYHGGSSMFQSLGLSHPAWDPTRRNLMRILALLIATGFAVIPIAVYLGWLS
jgi:succinate dehydrogenase / fumarate reductase cytochrome b subunit